MMMEVGGTLPIERPFLGVKCQGLNVGLSYNNLSTFFTLVPAINLAVHEILPNVEK